jgi:hypothetical protein
MASKQEVLSQIDAALGLWADHRAKAQHDDLSDLQDYALRTEVDTVLGTALERLAPAGSMYREAITRRLDAKIGALRALRRDCDAGYLTSLQGLIRAEVFADFLEMAEHLLKQEYKDPAAVLVGGVLEDHLRALCTSAGISVVASAKPKKADAMNNELAAAGRYNKLDQKNVTAWLDLRNKAAHGQYAEYGRDQVGTMLLGVQEFVARVPA